MNGTLTPSRLRRSPPLPHAGEGGARRASGGRVRVAALLLCTLALTACAAQSGQVVQPGAPGFWLGVWHGFIFPFAFIVSLFNNEIAVYAVPNNGTWYNFGYFVGVVFLGVGARSSKRR